jgi:hypothetical protein
VPRQPYRHDGHVVSAAALTGSVEDGGWNIREVNERGLPGGAFEARGTERRPGAVSDEEQDVMGGHLVPHRCRLDIAKGPAYFRTGRSIRHRVSDLDAWLAAHRVVTRDQAA